jgi:tetratricopeptide (TPR) repeat protein
LYARVLVQLEDSERAFYHFNQLVVREPSNADGLYAAGLLSLNNSDYVTGENLLVRHLKLRPGHDQTRLFLARLERERGRFDAARAWLRQVTDPEHYLQAQLRIAYVFAAEARFDEAAAHLAEIVPDSVEDQVRIYLAHEELLRDAGRLEDAYTLLNAALADLPDDAELLYARGLITAQMDILDVHERDMRRLIELKPDHAHAYNALGYTLADRTTRYEEARVLIEKALALKPDDPFILDSMGWVHYRLGNRDQARDYLQQAIDLRLDPEIAAHLGEVLWMMDRHEEARSVWERGESIDTKNKTLRETLRKFVK